MDTVRGFEDDRGDAVQADTSEGVVDEHRMEIGTDERRMHVRAYNHWVSLLRGRAYPSIENLDPENIADFGPNSVLLDFSQGIENPAIPFVGRALRDECAIDGTITHIDQVPSRSLLSRLTDHYLQIIANRAPIGFEAEFVNVRGHNTMYRGILMPFSSHEEETIDFIYGVINWKELVDDATQATLNAELTAALGAAQPTAAQSAWADGPSGAFDDEIEDYDAEDEEAFALTPSEGPLTLGDQLAIARESAAAVASAEGRTRAALYRALGRAHEFAAAADADPRDYEELLEDAGIKLQLRAPMTPIVKLVFGTEYDKTRLTEYAAVLNHARREGVVAGTLVAFLEGYKGGIKAIVVAERAAKAPVKKVRDDAAALGAKMAIASVAIDAGVAAGDYVVLLARAGEAGTVDIVATLGGDALVRQAMRAAV
ncbi:PAS domain-containing protein [Sphingomonas immobilis]|uniref:PAS domain-containing protein n=1 Tax=Sphingomonas immobilis TaxID=3063997 RepID=A0ABT9A1K0_9SPHN|nr:hypothetical protein [Sphingomonas sp. CA1-15]MDO7843705.1 hypothetical protein [Sphingomonas sp. CA1-15]